MNDCLSYKDTFRYKDLFIDYIQQKTTIQPFFNRYPKVENYKYQIDEKLKNYNYLNRYELVEVLKIQYNKFITSNLTLKHIDLLKQNNTLTITTGHQLNLFTGSLYTFYKIISVINTCKELKAKFPNYNFIPVFWLASEDHDFEEINHFNLSSKKIEWESDVKGAVGEIKISKFLKVYNDFKNTLPKTKNSEQLLKLFKASYFKHDNLSDATINLYNELFKEYGLVILEPNHFKLKSCFKKQIIDEVFEQKVYKYVSITTKQLLKNNYHKQVTPREINLFYKSDNLRERIVFKKDKFYINNTNLSFSRSEIKSEIEKYPEKFSPNALFRPLYQEVILPNLSYIGGAGELSYWLQLKSTFESFNVTFPMLQMRNSAVLYSVKTNNKLDKLNLNVRSLFLSQNKLVNQHVKQISKIKIDFSDQKRHLSKQFEYLYRLAEKTDKSFFNAVAAQEKKQHNGLEKLEKRLLKAQKRKLNDEVKRLINIQDRLFPNQNLQERFINFSELYMIYGNSLVPKLIDTLKPFDFCFSLIELENKPQTIGDSSLRKIV